MRALLKFLLFPSVVLGVGGVLIWLDGVMGWRLPRWPMVGGVMIYIGLGIIIWCVALFASIGQGTPHPFTAKTRRLVIAGSYRLVRNPMMWGVGTLLVGLALWMGSVGVWIWFAIFLCFILWFVPNYEERDMERRFGEEYREYCRQVPRWLPRLLPKR